MTLESGLLGDVFQVCGPWQCGHVVGFLVVVAAVGAPEEVAAFVYKNKQSTVVKINLKQYSYGIVLCASPTVVSPRELI